MNVVGKKQSGMILLTTLVFLFLLSLLVIAAIRQAEQQLRASADYYRYWVAFFDTECVMQQQLMRWGGLVQAPLSLRSKTGLIVDSRYVDQGRYQQYLLTVSSAYFGSKVVLEGLFRKKLCFVDVCNAAVKMVYWKISD